MKIDMRNVLLAALAPALWGTSYFVATELLPGFNPFFVAAARALPAGMLLTILGGRLPRGAWIWKSLLLGFLNIGLFFGLLFVGAYRAPGGIVATIGALQPIVVLLLTWGVLGRRPSLFSIGLGLIGFLGVGFLVFSPGVSLDPVGVLASVGAALSMATGVVLTKRWGRPASLFAFTGWQLLAGGIIVGLFSLLTAAPIARFEVNNVFGFVWLGLVNTAVGYLLWFRGIEKLRETWQVSILGLVSPLVAVGVGWAALGQELTTLQILGALLVLVGVGASQLATGKAPSQKIE